MLFDREIKCRLVNLMHSSLKAAGLERLIVLVSILKIMAECTGYQHITSAHAFYQSNELDIIRLNNIHDYTLSNYKREISLEEIASLSNMSVTSFCRYFKLMTKKTYNEFLTAIRISNTCSLRIEVTQKNTCYSFQIRFQ